MNWHPISTAPRDRLLLLTDGARVTVGRYDVYVQPERIIDHRAYNLAVIRYGSGFVPVIPMMPNPRAGEREDIWRCCGMALLDLDDDALSDEHHGDRIEAMLWAEFNVPEVA